MPPSSGPVRKTSLTRSKAISELPSSGPALEPPAARVGAIASERSIGHLLLWMFGVLLSFTVMAVSIRALGKTLNVFEILGIRNIAGVLVLGTMAAVRPGLRLHLRFTWIRLHLLRNIVNFAAQVAWALGITLLPFAMVFALEFTTPAWVAERPGDLLQPEADLRPERQLLLRSSARVVQLDGGGHQVVGHPVHHRHQHPPQVRRDVPDLLHCPQFRTIPLFRAASNKLWSEAERQGPVGKRRVGSRGWGVANRSGRAFPALFIPPAPFLRVLHDPIIPSRRPSAP